MSSAGLLERTGRGWARAGPRERCLTDRGRAHPPRIRYAILSRRPAGRERFERDAEALAAPLYPEGHAAGLPPTEEDIGRGVTRTGLTEPSQAYRRPALPPSAPGHA